MAARPGKAVLLAWSEMKRTQKEEKCVRRAVKEKSQLTVKGNTALQRGTEAGGICPSGFLSW